jgi:SAM-dependent methyltransferase
LQGRREEALAYAWLAGMTKRPPASRSSGHSADFQSDDYFAHLEDDLYDEYIQSNLDLIRFATPRTDASICDFGCGRGFLLRALRAAGYSNLVGYEISQAAVERRVADEVEIFPGFGALQGRRFDTVALISVLEHIEPDELDSFLAHVTALAERTVVCCIPIYPNNLLTFFDRDLTHRILAPRSWWDHQLRRHGFEPGMLPERPLPYVEPFIYRRRTAS